MTPKISTWNFVNATPTANELASKPTDIGLTVTADSIVKNGKATNGHTIHLTMDHLAQSDFSFAYDDTTRKATLKRSEQKRGRQPRKATPTATLTAFLQRAARKA